MRAAKFKIGDRVDTNWFGAGKVIDVMYSAHKDEYAYEVENDDKASALFGEEELKPVPNKDYSMQIKIDIANNVLIATLYESTGGVQKPVAKGHGHLIHEGEIGIAQAASYACNRLWKRVAGVE